MIIKKESYKEYDNSIEKVTVKHYDPKGKLIMENRHILTSKQNYEIDVFLDGVIKKTYGIYSRDFGPISSYEIEYKYEDNQTEILYYDVSLKSEYYSEIFQELVNKISLDGFEVHCDYHHLLTEKQDYSSKKKELVKVEQHNFNEQKNIELKTINDLKHPEKFHREDFYYNNFNQLIETKYTSIKNSIQKITAIDLYTYRITEQGNNVQTIRWKFYRDKYYIHRIENKITDYIDDQMFDGRTYSSKLIEQHEVNVNSNINEEYEYNNPKSFDCKKLFNTYNEVKNYILEWFEHDEKSITSIKYFEGEIQEEIKTQIYKGTSNVISHKSYSHSYDKENLYFNKFDIKSEKQNCTICYLLKPKSRMFSLKTFEYY